MAKIILRAGKVAIKIIIPFAILGLIFYSVKVLVPAKADVESFPEELAAQFDQAEAYREQGRYTEVEQIYQSIIEQYPLTDYDFEAQTQLTILYINWNKPAEAEAALEELTSSFYEHPGIAQAILAIAGSYYDVGKYENALELYEYTMSTWPDNAIWAGAGIIRANIVLGNDPNVPEAVDELLEQFSGSEFIVEAVLSIAGSYYDVRKYENARQLYEYVMSTWPDSKDAIWAGAGIIRANIDLGNDPNVPEAVDELLQQFSGSEFIAEAVFDIAGNYYDVGKYENALELYEYAISTWPDSKNAIWAGAGIIRANIVLGNDLNVPEAVDELLQQFSESEFIADALRSIADSYCEARKYEKAIELHQYTLQTWPDSKDAIWARAGIIRANIALGNDPNDQQLNELFPDFSEHPELPEAIFDVAGQYYKEAFTKENVGMTKEAEQYFQKAIILWETIPTKLPEYPTTANAFHFAARCYERLGKYDNAIEHFETVLRDWPGYQYAWSAQFLIGRCYRRLEKAGVISKVEADTEIRIVYEQLLQDYPNCPAARAAQDWFDHNN